MDIRSGLSLFPSLLIEDLEDLLLADLDLCLDALGRWVVVVALALLADGLLLLMDDDLSSDLIKKYVLFLLFLLKFLLLDLLRLQRLRHEVEDLSLMYVNR